MLKKLLFTTSILVFSASLQAKEIIINKLKVNDRYLIERLIDREKIFLRITDTSIGRIIMANQSGEIRTTMQQPEPSLVSAFGYPDEGEPKMPIAIDFNGDQIALYFGATIGKCDREVEVTAFAKRMYSNGKFGGMGAGRDIAGTHLNDILVIDADFAITTAKGPDSYRFPRVDEVPDQDEVSISTMEKKSDDDEKEPEPE